MHKIIEFDCLKITISCIIIIKSRFCVFLEVSYFSQFYKLILGKPLINTHTMVGIRCTNVPSFSHMSHFILEPFFSTLRYCNIYSVTHPCLSCKKKSQLTRLETLTRVECLTGILMDICPLMTFFNDMDMIEL